MKKTLAFLLSLSLILPMAACGGQTDAPAEEPTQQTEQTEVAADSAVSFDSSWTTNPAAMNIPEPPAEYTIAEKQSNDTFCLIEITYAPLDKIKEYCDYLQACGFNADVTAEESQSEDGRTLYNFKAKDADGCSVSLNFSEMDGDYTMTYMEIYAN